MPLVKRLYPLLFLLFTACLYKSIDRGSADEVITARTDRIGDKSVFTLFEAVFQASNKSYENGVHYISGRNDYRISVYDVETGTLLRRRLIGSRYFPLVGITSGNIWLYSPRKGLYSLDKSLFELRHTQKEILAANPGFSTGLAKPEPAQQGQYYGIDAATGRLVLTDNAALRYTLDETTLVLIPFGEDFEPLPVQNGIRLETSQNRGPDTYRLTGDLRRSINLDGKPVLGQESFIEGHFMPTPGSGHLFIAHKETVEPDAELLISCVKTPGNGETRGELLWTVKIPGVLFDINRADKRNSFVRTFSPGDPEFDDMRFETIDGRFCFVFALHAGVIDIKRGELLWLKRL